MIKKRVLSVLICIGLIIGIILCVRFGHNCENHIEWLDAMTIDPTTGEIRSAGICKVCNEILSFVNGELQK